MSGHGPRASMATGLGPAHTHVGRGSRMDGGGGRGEKGGGRRAAGPNPVYIKRMHGWLVELVEAGDLPVLRKYLKEEVLEILAQVGSLGDI